MPKVLWFRFEHCLGPFAMLLFEGSSETGVFRHLSNHSFMRTKLQKYISYESHPFFENFQSFIYISKMPKKT